MLRFFFAVSDIFCLGECSDVTELDLDEILFLTGILSILFHFINQSCP